jgi:hypothetical protein
MPLICPTGFSAWRTIDFGRAAGLGCGGRHSDIGAMRLGSPGSAEGRQESGSSQHAEKVFSSYPDLGGF